MLNFSSLTGDLTLAGLTITGGRTTGDNPYGGDIHTHSGGGIRFLSEGTLTLTGSTVSGNSTTGYNSQGGGIYSNSGAVSLTGSTVSGNSTTGIYGRGGGIYTDSGVVSLTGSTVSGNSTTRLYGQGGGIFTRSGAVSLTNSTVSGNSTTGTFSDGGGIFTGSGDVSLTSSTVSGNEVEDQEAGGGGIKINSGGSLTIGHSIVAGNFDSDGASDLSALSTNTLNINFSLIGNTAGSGITAGTGAGNILNQPALLGPLQNNGGTTETHGLNPGSPAIDNGDPNFNVSATPYDQRGAPFTRGFGAVVDMGSYEQQTIPVSNLVVSTIRDEGGVLERPDLIGSFGATFSANVNVSADDLVIRDDTMGGAVIDSSTVTVNDVSATTAVWDLGSLSLDPAFYTFELSEDIGLLGGAYTESVYVALPGDTNLDGQVNVLDDAFALVSNLGTSTGATWAQGDFNGDGAVDVLGDAFILVSRLGQSVVPPAPSAFASSFAVASSATTANYSTAAPVATSSSVAQPISFVSQQVDDRDRDSVGQRAKKSPDSTALSLAGSKNLDAAFESSDLIDVGIF